ncbi:LacI family DNA-binding transcriptional regulator [Chitinophaga qingshengii]|uniref:LacI family DNA-binding transcriptional regulator n=1 Tax=Chitinophaga qingshengii TaxID=1569794 RepID=A0ABR7TXL2_9BACT|nr:LacI family DNA-binding transcriptional regulator [Chitinophaga qingshengii]MBC9934788.1 LacI family DNA-binding transcriptional regulator [Chitinophaga qingshengii]
MKKNIPTIKAIALQLNISVSTVSKALNNHPAIGEQTREKVRQLAAAMHYVPNQTAIHFKSGKTHTIGVILPQLTDHFFTKALSGAEHYALQHTYNVISGQSYNHLQREKELVGFMQRSRVDGLIIALTSETESRDHLLPLEAWGIPIVYLMRTPPIKECHYVTVDVFDGAHQAVRMLLNRGHRRIAHLNGPEMLLTSRERQAGYLHALQQHQLPADPDLICHTTLSPESTRACMAQLMALPDTPTAILGFKDLVVLEAMQYVKNNAAGRRGPVDFIGFGNHEFLQFLDTPPTASIEENPFLLGSKAMEVLIQLISGGEAQRYQQVRMPCKLVNYK